MLQRPNRAILLCIVFFLAGCSYVPVTAPRRFNPANEPTLVPTSEAVAKPIYTIEQGLVTERLTFDARVSPRTETAVVSPIAATVLDVDVAVGDFVAEGDRIARFDFSAVEEEISTLQNAILEKEGQLATEAEKQSAAVGRTQIELDIAQLDLELAQQAAVPNPTEIDLLTRKVDLAQADFDSLQQAIDPDGVIAGEIAELEALIAVLNEQMAEQAVFAPADGTILGLGIRTGVRIPADQQIAIIGQMGGADDVSVSAVLRSENLERLATGMQVSLVFDSDPDKSYRGSIVRLPYPYNSGGNDLGFETFDNAVRILPEDGRLLDRFLPGEKVEVTITIDQNESALWLPQKAIREFSGRNFIVVRNGEREQRIDVELGLRGDGRVEILGAVEAGQEVIGP